MLDIDPGRVGPAPRAAATVVLLRDGQSGLEVFLVRRNRGVAFMGGAYVFPGGKLDEGDASAALFARIEGLDAAQAAQALGQDDLAEETALALYVAALRETFEEAGVLFARTPRPFDLVTTRARLNGGTSLAALADELDLTLQPSALVPFARWVTPAVEQRRFDARFFVAVAPPGAEAVHDDGETVTSFWKPPREAIEAHLTGGIDLPPPTLRTLEELASYERAEDVLCMARGRRVPYVCPVFRELADGTWILALPGDPEHSETALALPGPTRFTRRDGRFVSG